MIPKLLEIPLPFGIPPVPIHSFGLMMMLCFIAAWKRLTLSLQAAGEDAQLAERMITWAAIGGIAGAKLGYLLSYPGEFLDNPLGALFGGAGFVFYTGFIGGAFAVWVLLRREGKSFLPMADLTAPALAIGYAVGRIGCQLSGDGDYGKPSDLPWAIGYRRGVIPTPPGILVHPAPVYETLMALAIAALLLSRPIQKRFGLAGQIFGVYLCLSALARIFVEVIRVEPIVWKWFTQAQLVGFVLFAIGFMLIAAPKLRRV